MISVFDVLKRSVLVTRGSARLLEDPIAADLAKNRDETLVLDFKGIEAVTPSFIDEALGVIRDAAQRADGLTIRVRFDNAPTRLSSKFQAIGRARNLTIEESEGAWSILEPA